MDSVRRPAFFSARRVAGMTAGELHRRVVADRHPRQKAGLSIRNLDWIEVNEAFATVVLSSADALAPDMEKVNPWGGAIAHGHPLGATGAGLMAKMLVASKPPTGNSDCR